MSHSTAAQIRATLEKRAKTESQLAKIDSKLEEQLRDLPPGDARRDAVRACLNVGISQAELSLLLDVSRQRVSQLVREAQEIPL